MDHRILSEYIHIENKSKIMIQGVNKSVVNTYINYTINYSITKKCSVTHKQQHFHLITLELIVSWESVSLILMQLNLCL